MTLRTPRLPPLFVLLAVLGGGALPPADAQENPSARAAEIRQKYDGLSDLNPDLTRKMRHRISSFLESEEIPGVVVGVFIPGRGKFVEAFGRGDLKRETAVKSTDRFRIGDITKSFLATVLLQLQDENKLRLDDRAAAFFPEYPRLGPVTLRQLAGNTSGLFDYVNGPDYRFKPMFEYPKGVWKPEQLLRLGLKDPRHPVFAPGLRFDSCNTNFILLGEIIRKITGHPPAAEIEKRILRPLGLKETVFPANTDSTIASPFAHGYYQAEGKMRLPEMEPLTTAYLKGRPMIDASGFNPSYRGAAGAMISTLHDLKVWAPLLAQGTLLSPESQRQRTQFTASQPNGKVGYGLGLTHMYGFLGHNGTTPGYNCCVYHLPDQDATMVVLINSLHPTRSLAEEIFSELAVLLFPEQFGRE
ncbi:MAG: serine hydrolase domain-containing protein [Verrucomicrobiae bacterium]|nr:serine hydrolase domain-containing protein [Verrucomicrobiae bacterium]